MNMVKRVGILLSLILAGSTASAAEAGEWKVVGIYVREAESLFLDVRMAPRKLHDSPRWAEVKKLQALEGAKGITEMVPVPADLMIVPGDIVQLDLPLKIKQVQGLLPERAKIIALIAKAGSPQAATVDGGHPRLSMGSAVAP
jgi:enoyl-CoA hydratase/carnithine racemase